MDPSQLAGKVPVLTGASKSLKEVPTWERALRLVLGTRGHSPPFFLGTRKTRVRSDAAFCALGRELQCNHLEPLLS